MPGARGAPAGGRKRIVDTDPTLVSDLDALLEPITAGEPDDSPLRWTSKSVSKLTAELQALGHPVGHRVVNELLHQLGYTLQANRKSTEGAQHPDRDAQFNYLNEQVRSAQQQGHPVISVDTKKKELVGEFKNGGREWRAKGDPEQVKVHDFVIPEQGKAIPYGVLRPEPRRRLGQRGCRSRHGPFRRERDPQLVEPHGPLSLRRYWPTGDHRRCRRQQQSKNPAVEVGVAALRESHRADDHGMPLSAGHQQMEPHRAPAVLLHRHELARQAAGQLGCRGQSDRCHDDAQWPARALADRHPFVPSRGEGHRRAHEEHRSLTA